eukprot:5260061-Alexandrium_andersonii.AAC.1
MCCGARWAQCGHRCFGGAVCRALRGSSAQAKLMQRTTLDYSELACVFLVRLHPEVFCRH